jgi:hypothetical protein
MIRIESCGIKSVPRLQFEFKLKTHKIPPPSNQTKTFNSQHQQKIRITNHNNVRAQMHKHLKEPNLEIRNLNKCDICFSINSHNQSVIHFFTKRKRSDYLFSSRHIGLEI